MNTVTTSKSTNKYHGSASIETERFSLGAVAQNPLDTIEQITKQIEQSLNRMVEWKPGLSKIRIKWQNTPTERETLSKCLLHGKPVDMSLEPPEDTVWLRISAVTLPDDLTEEVRSVIAKCEEGVETLFVKQ